MVVVVCILDEARIDEVLDPVCALVSRQIGIVAVSDLAMVRQERF